MPRKRVNTRMPASAETMADRARAKGNVRFGGGAARVGSFRSEVNIKPSKAKRPGGAPSAVTRGAAPKAPMKGEGVQGINLFSAPVPAKAKRAATPSTPATASKPKAQPKPPKKPKTKVIAGKLSVKRKDGFYWSS